MKAHLARLRTSRTDDGVTLMELVVAIGVLMVVLSASLAVFITVQKSQQTAEGTDRAIQLANGRIERIRQLDWEDIGFYNDTFYTDIAGTDYNTRETVMKATATQENPEPETTVSLGDTETNTGTNIITPYEITTEIRNKFTVYTTITWGRNAALGLPYTFAPYSPADPYSYKRVRVTVIWQSNGNGGEHSVTSETWFAPQGYDKAPPGVPVDIE